MKTHRMTVRFGACCAIGAALFAGAHAAAEVNTFFFPLSGDEEVPPVPTDASGYCIVTIDADTRFTTAECTYIDLTSNCNGAHIHIGPPGVNGPVILGLTHTAAACGRAFGSGTLSEANADALLAGNTYVNVHSGNFPGGEIRGQVVDMPAPAPPMRDYRLFLTGDEEVPPVSTDGRGHCYITLNEDTRFVTVDCTFALLTSNASGAHIHLGPAGQNGPVILGLTHTAATCGAITGSGTLSQDNVDHMLNDNTYINLHSAMFPGGEVRAQLLNPDEPPPCPADLTGNGSVGVPDLLALLSCWGPVEPGCESADLTGSGSVGVPDLLALLSEWGPCPE